MLWRRFVWVGVVSATFCLPGCTGSTTGDAVVATAVTVAAVGVNRALTDECWAACSHGYVCDQKRGVCVPGECLPACVAPDQCTLVGLEYQCVPAKRTLVHGVIPHQQYTPTADADLGNRSASVAPGTQADPSSSYAGKSDGRNTLVTKRAQCPRAGSAEWHEEAVSHAGDGFIVGDRHRDLVGVWSTKSNALGVSKALVVTPSFVETTSARRYEVLDEQEKGLIVRAHPALSGVSGSEFDVIFHTRHQINLGGIELERYDCRVDGSHSDLCCRLPRERWVVLGPE